MRRSALPHRRAHLHQQGRPRDEGARGDPHADKRRPGDHQHLPLLLRQGPSTTRRAPRPRQGLHHLRPVRPDLARQTRHGREQHQRQAVLSRENPLRDLRGEEQAPRRRGLRPEEGRLLRGDRPSRLRKVRGPPRPVVGPRLRRPHPQDPHSPAGALRRCRELSRPLHPRHGRRVPGHQRRPVRDRQAAHGRVPQPLRRRRPRPVHLLVAQRRHPKHPQLPEGLRRRQAHLPRGELPLHRDDPRCRP